MTEPEPLESRWLRPEDRPPRPDAPGAEHLTCPQCGYCLLGIPESRCPECGFGFDRRALVSISLSARGARERAAFEVLRWTLVALAANGFCALASNPWSPLRPGVDRLAAGALWLAAWIVFRLLRDRFDPPSDVPWVRLLKIGAVLFSMNVFSIFPAGALTVAAAALARAWFEYVTTRRALRRLDGLAVGMPGPLSPQRWYPAALVLTTALTVCHVATL